MKILVTGGAGFIGSHIVDKLLIHGHDVVVIDDFSSGNRENVEMNNIRCYEQSILSSSVEEIFSTEKPDVVIHQAAQTSVQYSMNFPIIDAEVNVLGTLKMLEYCRKYEVGKFIFASSAAVYGEPQYLSIDEKHPLNPTSCYGMSKKAAEDYIRLYGNQYGLNYTILRYSNVYGPRQTSTGEAGVVTIFIDKFLNGHSPIIYGNGKQTRDFIYVEDVANANISALTRGNGELFNISTNQSISLLELLGNMDRLSGDQIKEAQFEPARKGDIQDSALSNILSRDKLDWEPLTKIREGLAHTVEFYKKQLRDQ